MSVGKLLSQLEALEQAAREAYAAHLKARERQRREHHHAARGVVSDLAALRDSILYRKPDAPALEDRPARERELTVALCKELTKRENLVLFPLGNSDALDVRDLSIDRDAAESNAVAVAARKRVRDFQEANKSGLQAEVNAADARLIKDALASGDGQRIREVLTV